MMDRLERVALTEKTAGQTGDGKVEDDKIFVGSDQKGQD